MKLSPMGGDWPGKQSPFGMGLPKKKGDGSKSVVAGGKKRVVIKLKKKSS